MARFFKRFCLFLLVFACLAYFLLVFACFCLVLAVLGFGHIALQRPLYSPSQDRQGPDRHDPKIVQTDRQIDIMTDRGRLLCIKHTVVEYQEGRGLTSNYTNFEKKRK